MDQQSAENELDSRSKRLPTSKLVKTNDDRQTALDHLQQNCVGLDLEL